MTAATDRLALMSMANSRPHEPTPKLVLADWLEENEEPGTASKWRLEVARPGIARVGHRTKYGYGYGNGYGNGDGDGDGYGDGNGYGNGYGNGKIQREEIVIEKGGIYLFLCPSWYVYAGKVIDQFGPYEYLLEDAIMVLNNGGHGWGAWASGVRAGSRVQRCGSPFEVGGPFAGKYRLVGELPLAGEKTFDVVTL